MRWSLHLWRDRLPHYNSNSLCTMLKWTIIKALISKSVDLGYTWPGLSEVQRNVRDPRGVVRTPRSRSVCPEWTFWMAGWGCFVVMPRVRWKSWRRRIRTPWNRRPWESSSSGGQNTGSPLLQTCSRIECMTFSDLFVRIPHAIWDRTDCDSEKEQVVPY